MAGYSRVDLLILGVRVVQKGSVWYHSSLLRSPPLLSSLWKRTLEHKNDELFKNCDRGSNRNYLEEKCVQEENISNRTVEGSVADTEPSTGGVWWYAVMCLAMNPWSHRISDLILQPNPQCWKTIQLISPQTRRTEAVLKSTFNILEQLQRAPRRQQARDHHSVTVENNWTRTCFSLRCDSHLRRRLALVDPSAFAEAGFSDINVLAIFKYHWYWAHHFSNRLLVCSCYCCCILYVVILYVVIRYTVCSYTVCSYTVCSYTVCSYTVYCM